jgi:hypothetical protein
LSCKATISDSTPARFSTVYVYVATSAGAAVTATAHYKTTTTTHSGTADPTGKATIPFYISGATAGYTVLVSVSVSLSGKAASCSTPFTPH